MQKRLPIRIVLMGVTGTGKDTFAHTLPNPKAIHLFDAPDKAIPYMKKHPITGMGKPVEIGEVKNYEFIEGISIDTRMIQYEGENEWARVFYWNSKSIYQPDAYPKFKAYMDGFYTRGEDKIYNTFILSSATNFELQARKLDEYVTNSTVKDGRQHYGASTKACEELFVGVFPYLPMNVVLMCHIENKQDQVHGDLLFNPRLPGQLSVNISSNYGEHYRALKIRDVEGNLEYVLNTRGDDRYAGQTHIDAPEVCEPVYDALWTNWE